LKLGAERSAVQDAFLRYAEETSWTRLDRQEAEQLRGGEDGTLLSPILIQQLERLNPGFVDRQRAEELVHRIARVQPSLAGNLEVWEQLRGLGRVFAPEERRERDVRLVDFANVENNQFHVTDEWSFRPRPDAEAVRFDIVLLINGLPVLVVETKAAHKREGMQEALKQVSRYHEQGPGQLVLIQVFGITHILRFLYGPTWNVSQKSLYDWREEAAGDFEALVKAFVEPRRILRLLADFILFTTTDGELAKFILRPHQMRAADRVVQRAKDPAKNRALVWHTQGSGKTYTMLTAAKLLREQRDLDEPTVLVLVDRIELEGQMAGHLEALGLKGAQVAESKDHLQRLLAADTRGVILSMIHKFENMPPNVSARRNIFVLIDEAHRSTTGTLGSYLMGALPNATYVGFTGTPIDKTAHGKGTFSTFGRDDGDGYLDKYSIRESIADGATLPLNYSLAPNELLVDRDTLESEFLQVAELEGVSDVETLNKVLERAVTLRNMMKNRDRVEAVASRVAEHYRENVEPMGYKAFLVAVDREACVLYKDALDRFLPPDYSEVVISHGHNDPAGLRRFHYDERREEDIRKSFRKADRLPKILIVTEKLLTGFDAPILYAMYLDKPVRDHVLLQAIARVNRPYEDSAGRQKPAGLVLDFVGIFEKLEDALAFDSKDVSGVVTGLPELQRRFAELLAQGKGQYLSLAAGRSGDKAVEAVVDYFRDDNRRAELEDFISEIENLFEILSPDAFLRPYLDDYDALMTVARIVREAFNPGLDIDRSFLNKTAQLVQEHTMASAIGMPRQVHALTESTLEGILEAPVADTVKVVNLVKLLHDRVAEEKASKPFLISIGERAEQLAEAYRNRQISTEDALTEFEKLGREAQDAQEAQEQSGLPVDAFAICWYLQGRGLSEDIATAVASVAAAVFVECPQWRVRPDQDRTVRLKLTAALLKVGEQQETAQYVDDMLTSLRSVRQ
jgi:type I restriction enzyme R subunit